jgi:hypothetical protein
MHIEGLVAGKSDALGAGSFDTQEAAGVSADALAAV